LTPFDPPDDLVEDWTNGEFSFTGRYAALKNPELYTEWQGSANYNTKFYIRARFALYPDREN
jgi:hypothetical protein